MILALAVVVAAVVPLRHPPRAIPAASARAAGRPVGRLRAAAEQRLPSLYQVSDRTIAGVMVGSVALAAVFPPLVVAGPVVLAAEAVRRERAERRRHDAALVRALPELVDQLALAVGAGLSLPLALRIVAPWLPVELRPIVSRALARLDAGSSTADSLRAMAADLPDAARRPITVLIAATRDGAPLGASLAQAAAEARRGRRRAAEIRARRLPVLMLLPLVLCVLPAFVLLTLVPLVLGSLDGLQFPSP